MIAITGGGTGGHLAIAKAFANELNSRGIKAIFKAQVADKIKCGLKIAIYLKLHIS